MSKAGRTKRSQSNSKKQAKSESPEKVTETCFVFLIYDRTKEPQAKYTVTVHFNFMFNHFNFMFNHDIIEGELF